MKLQNLPGVLPVGHVIWSKYEEWLDNQKYELTITPRVLKHLSTHPRLKPGCIEKKWPEDQNPFFENEWMITGRDNFNNYEHVIRSRNVPTELDKIPELLKIEDYYFNLNKQEPGACSPMHVDSMSDFYCKKFKSEIPPKKQSELGRILVALDDWVPGHFWAVDDIMWKDYKIGDMIYVDVWNLMHGTGNASFSPRHTLLIDGIYSEKTIDIIMNNTVEIDLDLGTIELTLR